jgi:DNA-binding NtrC family response regulator
MLVQQVVTGVSSVAHAKEATRIGAFDCLAKPVSPDQVIMVAAGAAMHEKRALRRIPAQDSAQPTH